MSRAGSAAKAASGGASAADATAPTTASGASAARASGAPPHHLAADEDLLLACVHCGFCLSACPTYDVLGDENDSPRGRLYLMRALLEGRAEASGAFELHIGQCLGCRACEPVCPAGVEYGALLESARADGVERRRNPAARLAHLAGRLGLRLLTGPLRRPLFALLRLARRSGLSRLAGRLPGRAGLAARLLDATRPDPALHARPGRPPAAGDAGASAGGPGGASSGASAGGYRGPAAEAADPDAGGDAAPADAPGFALLEGCVMDGLFAHVHGATRRVLAAAGFREVAAPAQGCCGALHAHAGFLEAARRLARRNVEAFEAAEADVIAVNSAGCGAAMREYRRWLAEEPEWAERAGRLADRVRDVSQLLAAAPTGGRGTRAGGRLASGPAGNRLASGPAGGRLASGPAGRIAYDAPCHLLHGQGVRDEPLELLAAIPGGEAAPLPSSDRCCGGAGVYNLLHRRLSERVLAPKLEEVASGGYAWVATGNPGCIMQIGAGLRATGSGARAVHPVELLDASRAGDPGGRSGPWS